MIHDDDEENMEHEEFNRLLNTSYFKNKILWHLRLLNISRFLLLFVLQNVRTFIGGKYLIWTCQTKR